MIAVEIYYDDMFKTVAGWLKWPPDIILDSTISQLELAIEGAVDYAKKTNPFGGGEGETDEEKMRSTPPAPELAMQQLVSLVKRRQGQANRTKRK